MTVSDHGVPVRVDHVGIAVRAVDDAEPVLTALGCEKLADEAVTEDGSVPIDRAGDDARFRWAYYRLGDASRLELVEPLGDAPFLDSFLEDQGPGLHHVTLEVGDVDALADHLETQGLDVVDRETLDGWTEAFVSPSNPTGTLFQLMEYHDDYEAGRRSPADLYVGGARVGAGPRSDERPTSGEAGDR